MNRKLISPLFLCALTAACLAYATLREDKIISTTGEISAIGVSMWTNQSCIKPLETLDWGTVDPDVGSISKLGIIRNDGNVDVWMAMNTINWNPSDASIFLSLTWNYNDEPLHPNFIVPVTFTLHIDETISGITDFSFDICITAMDNPIVQKGFEDIGSGDGSFG